MELFLLNIFFWSVVYIIDAYADSKVSNIISLANHLDHFKTNKFSAQWHNSRLIYYSLFHLLFSYLIYIKTDLLFLSFAQLLLSLEIKLVVRGSMLSIFLQIPLFEFHINGKWDWFDNLLVWLNNKLHIRSYILIYVQFILFIAIYYYSFLKNVS